jgi:hypothetical protein
MILQLSEDEFVSSEDWSAIMEQMIPINYVGHGGTYDQQDEIDGVKTIEFTTLRDFLDVDNAGCYLKKKSSDKQYITLERVDNSALRAQKLFIQQQKTFIDPVIIKDIRRDVSLSKTIVGDLKTKFDELK